MTPTDTGKGGPRISGPTAAAAWPRRLGRRALRIGIAVLAVYVGVLAVLYSLQTRLIFPGAATKGTPEGVARPRAGAELVRLTAANGEPVVAMFGPALGADGKARADAATRPTVLFFYGNGMCLAACDDLFEMFRRLGANVMIPDYLGYGMSGGAPGEAGCYEAAEAAFRHLQGRNDVDPRRIIAAGWSLGGAVAIDLASRHPGAVAALAVFSTFTSLADMVAGIYPFVPASLLLAHKFDSLPKIARVSCPVLIGHGTADEIVSAAMAPRLAAAVKTPCDAYTVAGAGHNDFFEVGRAETVRGLSSLLDRVP